MNAQYLTPPSSRLQRFNTTPAIIPTSTCPVYPSFPATTPSPGSPSSGGLTPRPSELATASTATDARANAATSASTWTINSVRALTVLILSVVVSTHTRVHNCTSSTEELTQDPHAGMFWTLEDYLDVVCGQYGYKLVGWPQHVTFANLSRIRGGVDRLSHLLRLWETGRMRFVPLTDDEHHLLRTDAERLAPAPVELCARSTSRSIRRDCGERRKPKRLPNGRVVDGPKTPVRVPESDEEDPIED